LVFLWILLIHLFPFSFCYPAGGAEVLRIEIPSSVQMEGQACTLSEIAAIDGPPELVERVGALLLSVQNGVITRERVIGALKASGAAGARIELKMPAAVTVIVESGESGGETPVPRGGGREGLALLIKSLAAWDGEVEVQYQGVIPEGRLVSPVSLVPGTSAASLKFRDTAGRERSLAVRLVWTQPALVLTRSVKKGEVLRETDFAVRKARVSKPGVYASKISEVAGRSLKKNLNQGEVIFLSFITDVPIMERGKRVTITARNGDLTVKAQGEALESGALGDVVRVRNLSSKAVVTAVIVAGDMVEVTLSEERESGVP
jgi:flagella basal body P-ring formation protein FlgA